MPQSSFKPRRRLRYSLRTMFVVVTVIAVFIAYHVNWIRQRHEFLAEEELKRDGHVSWSGLTPPSAPSLLFLFREPGASSVWVMVEGDDIDQLTTTDLGRLDTARRLFPEAIIGAVYIQMLDGSMREWHKAWRQPDQE